MEESNNKNRKSIISDKPIINQTPPTIIDPKVGWRVNDFEELIQAQGYDAYIDRALRCPCLDKTTGQANTTCKNCLGRGWFFVNRTTTRIISQSMDNKKRYQNWSEINRGTASITTKGVDKLGFMDRVILVQLEAYYSEVLRPTMYEGELLAYPIYEPLEVTNIYLYIDDDSKLYPIPSEMYKIDGNKMIFDPALAEAVEATDINQKEAPVNISIRYSYYPVYHVIDANRELMKVRERTCSFSDEALKAMPINVLARKAHYIFCKQTYGNESFENSILQE